MNTHYKQAKIEFPVNKVLSQVAVEDIITLILKGLFNVPSHSMIIYLHTAEHQSTWNSLLNDVTLIRQLLRLIKRIYTDLNRFFCLFVTFLVLYIGLRDMLLIILKSNFIAHDSTSLNHMLNRNAPLNRDFPFHHKHFNKSNIVQSTWMGLWSWLNAWID